MHIILHPWNGNMCIWNLFIRCLGTLPKAHDGASIARRSHPLLVLVSNMHRLLRLEVILVSCRNAIDILLADGV